MRKLLKLRLSLKILSLPIEAVCLFRKEHLDWILSKNEISKTRNNEIQIPGVQKNFILTSEIRLNMNGKNIIYIYMAID